MMFRYSIKLAWSDEDGGYIATIPEFPNLSAFGKTPEKALQEARNAAKLFLEVLEEDGEKAPEPIKLPEYSGTIRLRMPKNLHRDMAAAAEREGVSLNTYMVSLLQGRNSKERAFETALRELKEISFVQKIDDSDTGRHTFSFGEGKELEGNDFASISRISSERVSIDTTEIEAGKERSHLSNAQILH